MPQIRLMRRNRALARATCLLAVIVGCLPVFSRAQEPVIAFDNSSCPACTDSTCSSCLGDSYSGGNCQFGGCTTDGCPTIPVLERSPGVSLYWSDPACCRDDPCRRPSCVDTLPALIYADVGAAFLTRDKLNGGGFQRFGIGGGDVLREAHFDTPFDAGIQATIGATLSDFYRIEASYLSPLEWQDSISARNNGPNAQGSVGNLFSPFTDRRAPNGLVGFDFNNQATIRFNSELESIELNLKRRFRFPDVDRHRYVRHNPGSPIFLNRRMEGSFLVGVRYLKIDEQFSYSTQSVEPVPTGTVNQIATATGNEMIGAQVGIELQFSNSRRGWLDVELKGGIYQNQVTLTSAFNQSDLAGIPGANFADAAERDATSWVGDLSIVYNHLIGRNATFRVGYTALAVADVAVASSNFSQNLDFLTVGPVSADANADIVYHGPVMGLTWTR